MKNTIIILFIILSSAASATTYYIDPAGSNTNNGSKSSPWKNLSYACSRVTTSGDIIHVNPGTYYESSQSSLAVGVSIEGEGSSSNIVSSISKTYAYTIDLVSSTTGTKGNQHISGIRMDGNRLTAYAAIKVYKRSNVEIFNCTFIDFSHYGVAFDGGYEGFNPPSIYATGNKFHDNTIFNCSGYYPTGDKVNGVGNFALGIDGQEGMLVYNNNLDQTSRSSGSNGYVIKGVPGFNKGLKIYNNTIRKAPYDNQTWDFAIELWLSRGGIEIYNNIITAGVDFSGTTDYLGMTTQKGSYPYSVYIHDNIIGPDQLSQYAGVVGIYFEQSTEYAIVEANHIKNVALGVYFPTYTKVCPINNIDIRYNLIENIGVADGGTDYSGWAIYFYHERNDNNVNNVRIFNNTIIGHKGSNSSMWGIQLPDIGTVTNVVVRNNIVQDFDYAPLTAGTTGGSSGVTIDQVSIENNIFYNNGNNNTPYYRGVTLTNNTTRNNTTGNPLFEASDDFHLQPGSPAIGKGLTFSGITTDFDGNAINDPPSIGAYEYTAGTPVFTTAAIENSTPAALDMYYSLSLANIIPATSSFIVQVNGVERQVNSVAISGKKVMLTLSSRVLFGDVINVTYNEPGTNPLQTSAGMTAASISNQQVTNKCVSNRSEYVSSSVENLAPSEVVVNFSLSLAAVVPSTSAFSIGVNSVNRTVTAVRVEGKKVYLTLSSPVVYGDVVNFSYTKPSTGYLQTETGEAVNDISSKLVTNNCLDPDAPNDAPVAVISSAEEGYSGFVYTIDASGSYDANNDELLYEWLIPDNVAVSSTTDSRIRFLAPFDDTPGILNFTLNITDGRAIVSEEVSINILPYKPELFKARIANLKASNYEVPNIPTNVLDGNLNTLWSVNGDNEWMVFTLPKPFKIDHLTLGFLPGQNFSSYFDIYASTDSIIWEPVLLRATSCDFSGDAQVFNFPAGASGIDYSFLKLIGHGTALNSLNTFSEFSVLGVPQEPGTPGTDTREIIIYPNPTTSFFNISVEKPDITLDIVRLIDLAGKIVYENRLDAGFRNVQLPTNVRPGIYIVELRSGDTIFYAERLVVAR